MLVANHHVGRQQQLSGYGLRRGDVQNRPRPTQARYSKRLLDSSQRHLERRRDDVGCLNRQPRQIVRQHLDIGTGSHGDAVLAVLVHFDQRCPSRPISADPN